MKQIYITLIVLSIVLYVLPIVLRRIFIKKITNQLILNNKDNFNKLIENKIVKLIVPPINIDFFKLNMAMLNGDTKKTDECLDRFDVVKLKEKEKKNIYSKAFAYFIETKDKERINKYYEYLRNNSDDNQKHQLDIYYNTYIESDTKYLKEIQKKYDDNNSIELVPLLIQMYENKKDDIKYKKYLKLFKDYMNNKNN